MGSWLGLGWGLSGGLLGAGLAELLLQQLVEISGDLVHVDGVVALDEDAAVGSIHLLDVGLVVVGRDLVHARGREVAHVDGPVSVVDHGWDVLVEVAQAGSKVRLELLLSCGLRSLVLVVAAAEGATNQRGSNSDGCGGTEGGLNESGEGDEGDSCDGGEGNHFC